MGFLPDNYESPKQSGQYMKLAEGDNRIRILTRPIMGWEDWHEKTPVRFTLDNKPIKSIDPKKPVRHFWAFIVYNYNEQKIQILNVTQATIRKGIENLCRDADWGDPYLYDIKINKMGEGKDTEYSVNPVPHKLIDEYIVALFQDTPCYLEALYINEDPFAPHDTHTPLGIAKKPEVDIKVPSVITPEQATQLIQLLTTCEPEYVKKLWKTLNDQKINSISQLPCNIFERVMNAVKNNQRKSENDIDVLFPITNIDELVGSVGA